MNRKELTDQIRKSHEAGKRVAVSFCSHVPLEVLEAAGFEAVRLPQIEETLDSYPAILPKNLCPTVRSCCAVCQDPAFADVDLVITESSCDGKKKMYELLEDQGRFYYYQVPQAIERAYSKPLIISEIRHMIKMLKERFGIEVTDDMLREAGRTLNAERESVMELLMIQKNCPPPAAGLEIYEELEKNRAIFDREERISANKKSKEDLLKRAGKQNNSDMRILVTGCPIGGVYRKVLRAVEENGGVVVCFENCEAVKTGRRHVDTEAPDIIDALAECYLNTSCAIMAPNTLRFEQLNELVEEYQVDGVIDVTLPTCHAYSVEKYKVQRFMKELRVPYIAIETGDSDSDVGQLTTRISAFIEML